jgi:alkylated DNA repair protein alkB family protein 7
MFFSLFLCSRRYEQGHWDAVITKYKEVELHDDSLPNSGDDDDHDDTAVPRIIERIRRHLAERHLHHLERIQWLPCHAIDLKKDGELNPHVDSVRFSGDLVAGLSLLSPSIMRLVPDPDSYDDGDNEQEEEKEVDDGDKGSTATGRNDRGQRAASSRSGREQGHVDLFLPPQSLYALTGVARYKYSHQILPDSSTFTSPTDGRKIVVQRDHRLSVIFRDAKRI